MAQAEAGKQAAFSRVNQCSECSLSALARGCCNTLSQGHTSALPPPHAGCTGTMSDTMMQMLHRLSSRKVLAHLCPGSPMNDERNAARSELQRHGIELAHDGMEIEL